MPRTLEPPLLSLLAVLTLPALGVAADPPRGPKPGDALFDAFLAREADQLGQRVFDGATTLEEWQARRPRLRRELLDMLGLDPLPAKTPLQARVTATFEPEKGVTVENVHFQSRPGLYVTGNLYRPTDVAGKKLPAILYVCGHSPKGRDGNKTAFQDHGAWFGRNGYICLVVDTLQLGELPGIHHGTYNRGRWWWQAAGYTSAGVECWNGVRAIDYLLTRPDVDHDRLAVTGISGGGAATFWIAAVDERVRCAVPVSGMSDLESYVGHKVVNGHCDCMFCYNTYRWEWTTIAALIAPRPLLFANSDKDSLFPMDGNRRIIARLKKLYGLYGKPELVAEHVSPGGHDYRPDLRLAVFGWINRHVKGDAGPVQDATDPKIDGKRLRVFPEDVDLPADSLNASIDEHFVPGAAVTPPARTEEFAAWKAGLVKQLRDRSFRAWPERIPAAEVSVGPAGVTHVTEPGVDVSVTRRRGKDGTDRGTLIVLNPGEKLASWAAPIVGTGDVVELEPRGVGDTDWTHRSPPNYVERAHALVGRTIDEGRVRDVAAILRQLVAESDGKRQWTVAGSRQAGVVAAYAALLEPSAARVVVVDPPASHRSGPIFLGVLRVLDVPEALGLLAPTPLTLIEAPAPAFDRTARIYETAGAKDAFRRADRP